MADGEIREGFLCPICMQDLGTVSQLTDHFEVEHSNVDGDVINQIKGLFNKAKKKILKDDASRYEEVGAVPYVSEKPVASAVKVSGIDPTLWEPQSLGATRTHIDLFKRVRDDRFDRNAIETNKLLIRLDKLLAIIHEDPSKRKAKEQTIVTWKKDSMATHCTCGKHFTVLVRKHHCRLCGDIMCNRCSHFMPVEFAKKLTNPSFHYEGQGFHRSSSNSSINSLFSPEGDLHIRTCDQCRLRLERRDKQMEQRNLTPVIVTLYEKLKKTVEETDRLLPHYMKMLDAISSGETTYSLEDAQMLRNKIMKYYEALDSVSKRILNFGLDQTESPSQKQVQLQRMIRVYASGFIQDNLMGLQSLPSAEEFEKLKQQRKQEIQQKIETERLAAAERAKLIQAEQKQDVNYVAESRSSRRGSGGGGGHSRQGSKGFVQDQGWKPSEIITHHNSDDPMVQQMNNIKGYIRQAKEADRWEEAQMFEQNLKELQQAYWHQKRLEKQQSEQSYDDSSNRQRIYNGDHSGASSSQRQQQTVNNFSSSNNSTQRQHLQSRTLDNRTSPTSYNDDSNHSSLSPNSSARFSQKVTALPGKFLDKVKPKKKSLNPFDEDSDEERDKMSNGGTTSGRNCNASKKSLNPFEE